MEKEMGKMAEKNTEHERNGSLDFIKIVFTVLIVFHHYQQTLEVTFSQGVNYFNGKIYVGVIADCFFVISGFLMLKWTGIIGSGQKEGELIPFMGKRLKRLVPMVLVTALCYEALCIIIFKLYPAENRIYINFLTCFEAFLCLQCGWCFNNDMWVNSPTWYISVLVLCYVIFYFVTALCRKKKYSLAAAYIAVVIIACGTDGFGINLPFLNAYSARGMRGFFVGLLLAMADKRYDLHGTAQIIICLAVCAIASTGLLTDTVSVTVIVFPAVIVLMTVKPVKKLFSSKFWTVLGNIQFHVYLWHQTLLTLIILFGWMGHAPNVSSRITMYIFAAFAELFGAFSYFVLEKPAEKFLIMLLPKRITPRKDKLNDTL